MHSDLSATRFYLTHLWLPLAVILPLGWLLMGHGGDTWLADALYRWEGGRWALRNHLLTQAVLHDGGRRFSLAIAVTALVALAASTRIERLRQWRRPLLYLVLATAAGALSVSLLKAVTNMDCPWDLARYGGERPFIGLFTPRPADLPNGRCFPAGHASSGYAWFSMYFFLLAVRPAWARYGLLFALVLGAVFGAAQQLRGAHFLSHDLSTLAICWLVALGLYLAMLAPPRLRIRRRPDENRQ